MHFNVRIISLNYIICRKIKYIKVSFVILEVVGYCNEADREVIRVWTWVIARAKKKCKTHENTNEKNESEWWAPYWSFVYLSERVQAVFLMSLVMRVFHCVERFHMTSWRPMILVFRNNEMLVFETNPVKAFFCSNNLHRCWSREWKRSIILIKLNNVQANIVIPLFYQNPQIPIALIHFLSELQAREARVDGAS